MKYSSTPKMINTLVFAILFAGFVAMGIYFTFLNLPFLWESLGSGPIESLKEVSVGLIAMLGSLGIAGAIISGLGLLRSIRSLLKANDDNLVRKSFDCYFSLGYLLVIALFLNATWLIRLTTVNFGSDVSMGFVIAVYVIALILVMVGTNIPLVKVYEDDTEAKGMGRVLLLASLAGGLGVAVSFLYAGIVTAVMGGGLSGQSTFLLKYFTLSAAPVLGAILACFGLLLLKKGSGKASSVLLYSSLGVYGLGVMYSGVLALLFNNTTKDKYIFMEQTLSAHPTNWMVNTVLGFVIGGTILIAAIVLVVITLLPKKEKKKAAK